jgi:hypothetical protein
VNVLWFDTWEEWRLAPARPNRDALYALITEHLCSLMPRHEKVNVLCKGSLTITQVLQEVAAARHLAIMCGEAEITGDSFARGLLACLDEIESPSRNIGATLVGMMDWEAPQYADPEDPRPVSRLNIMSLGQLLDRLHLHKATDQRDKVFALLGICGAADHPTDPPLPDYTQSWSSIFQDVILYLLGPQVKAPT